MGTGVGEAAIVPLIVSAIGAGATAYNAHQTLKDQDNVAAQGLLAQGQRQKQADQRVSQEVNALDASSPEASRKAATDNFLTALKQNQQQARGGKTVGAVSGQYDADSAAAGNAVDQFGRSQADVLGRINAPGLQRQDEAQGRARLGSDLGLIGRNSQADAFLTDLRSRSIQANPWINAGATLAGGVASGMASTGGATGSSPVKPVTLTGDLTRRYVPPTKAAGNVWGGG